MAFIAMKLDEMTYDYERKESQGYSSVRGQRYTVKQQRTEKEQLDITRTLGVW